MSMIATVKAGVDNVEIVAMTPEQLAEHEAKVAEDKARYEATKYAKDRAMAYPPIADQLDMLYHDAVNGTTTWQEAVAAVKAAHPKPE